jgi:hypothetical protein
MATSSVSLLIQMRLLPASCNSQFTNVRRPMDKTAGYLVTTGPLARVHVGTLGKQGRWGSLESGSLLLRTMRGCDRNGWSSDSVTLCIPLCCYRTSVSPKHGLLECVCLPMQIKARSVTDSNVV